MSKPIPLNRPVTLADSATGGVAVSSPMLPPALDAQRRYLKVQGRTCCLYVAPGAEAAGASRANPLLLIHSVNAAPSAAEVRPIFDAFSSSRPVFALELPGFGSSPRSPGPYTPALMRDAILSALGFIEGLGFDAPADVLGVSLSSEFVALAAQSESARIRSVALVSPTGLESRHLPAYQSGRTKDKPWLRRLLESGPWSQALFDWLTRKASMRKFLERTWGSRRIDERLLAYNLLTTHQPGARHAPYAFIAGSLFTRGIARVYRQLRQPVWMAHGVHGEFSKFDGLETLGPRTNWTVESFDAGAMPYFQRPVEFAKAYARFLARQDAMSPAVNPEQGTTAGS